MEKRKISSMVIALTAAGMFAGCATKPPPPPRRLVNRRRRYVWNDTSAKGPPKIVVDVSAQRAYFYRGDVRIGENTLQHRQKGFCHAGGNYAVTQKERTISRISMAALS